MPVSILENGDEIGGTGGAIHTGLGSSMVFERRAIMQFNTGASGGALYNLGATTLGSNGFIRGNQATVRRTKRDPTNAHALMGHGNIVMYCWKARHRVPSINS